MGKLIDLITNHWEVIILYVVILIITYLISLKDKGEK